MTLNSLFMSPRDAVYCSSEDELKEIFNTAEVMGYKVDIPPDTEYPYVVTYHGDSSRLDAYVEDVSLSRFDSVISFDEWKEKMTGKSPNLSVESLESLL